MQMPLNDEVVRSFKAGRIFKVQTARQLVHSRGHSTAVLPNMLPSGAPAAAVLAMQDLCIAFEPRRNKSAVTTPA